MQKFEINSEFFPTGDQPQAIDDLVKGSKTEMNQTLLGVTGSGKTFTVANVIANTGKNALIISHNKTLAAQLYSELKQFFPKNNVGYFVSYYDYYQPESYLPQTDTYIEKDTQINEKIEKLRLEATAMLLSGEPTIIISTVSCIYSLGSPKEWEDMAITLNQNEKISRTEIIKKLINARYERNDVELIPGNFRVKGDTLDVMPAYSQDVIRISLFGDEIEKISILDNVSLDVKKDVEAFKIFPAKHYLIAKDIRDKAVKSIKSELKKTLTTLPELEKQRLEMRTKYDLEMIEELGYCSGIENYSRHFDGRSPGEPAFCLLDFFGKEFLLIIDESHVTLPQLHGMYKGDFSRKKSLIDYGFRLPSAFDNRPLKFEEFEKRLKDVIFVSATPGEYEKKRSKQIVEQLVRPTGLVEPNVEIRKSQGQMDDLIKEISIRAKKNERTLVTTLTKRMAEDLAEYLSKKEVRVRYLHSEIEGLQRTELIRQLRLGEFDVLVGINLLREGLDIPEVSLVAILDADKEGFLRNDTSLIQTCGRAARNIEGKVIMYADNVTRSMKSAISETERRRQKQIEYNETHAITPKTIIKSIPEQEIELDEIKNKSKTDLGKQKIEVETQMKVFAEDLDFENAIRCRDKIKRIEKELQKDESK
ncbi:MAG: excinuclease ABC subunit UvrB [Thaumarchaeota archaeon]|nr:excinuclease ABC subunit UvrB [Nitrososphaerota archaeon]MBT4056935.1 excinuclease ABC subunit UvrB [Nitrososphaerota archaeon]MBT4972777.1 excinuclease ABC subunit UvrB [Nitrososphaerota archaeon]MBT5993252.1 excinuclease ABC subunit UvrB [Nitrososphaerota archaeon]MBT6370519.1 excinuclease ABC subunit UvrB [Nitrososphaerota archaeon]